MDSMTFQSIYTQLLDGKKLTISFLSPEEAEVFRVKMSRYKSAQEALVAVVDMKMGSENKYCRFHRNGINSYGEEEYVVSFSERRAETHYHILAIE